MDAKEFVTWWRLGLFALSHLCSMSVLLPVGAAIGVLLYYKPLDRLEVSNVHVFVSNGSTGQDLQL